MAERFTQTQFDLEYFFELYPDLICIAGEDGFLKKINPAVHMLLGYSDEELFSSPIDTFIHPEDQSIARERRKLHLQGEKLLEYENRYLTKHGETVWLSWTSVFVERDKVIFSIAKDITQQRRASMDSRFSAILERLGDEQRRRFAEGFAGSGTYPASSGNFRNWIGLGIPLSIGGKNWLQKFEHLVRVQASISQLNLKVLSSEMAMSERQLYRQVNRLVGITPKKLVTLIRLQIIWEAISSGKQMSIPELSVMAGYASPARCRAAFQENFGIDLMELL